MLARLVRLSWQYGPELTLKFASAACAYPKVCSSCQVAPVGHSLVRWEDLKFQDCTVAERAACTKG